MNPKELKETLNLPKTHFPMRANLPQNEPHQVKKWDQEKMYSKILEANKGKKKYILHDGPPYANGNIHLGHALNKILKDIIVKYKNMTDHFAPYIPGWDCHGLPIELQVEKNIGRAKKNKMSKVEVRRYCREYAEKYIDIQREEFKRLGILGDWEHPYRTIDYLYEAAELKELGKFISTGSLYRSKKPVYWCTSCVTALAEAEVEYEDHISSSIYVKFPVIDSKGKFIPDSNLGTFFVIWTTTPWTLPANQAIALHPDLIYRHIKTLFGGLIVTQDLVQPLMEIFGLEEMDYEITPTAWKGQELEGIVCRHPWIDRDVKVVTGDYITNEQGTGCVHIAPGHGQEDYEVGLRYGLEISSPVDSEGKFTSEVGELAGDSVFKADGKVIDLLTVKGALIKEEKLSHSYPHCWRCKKPVIFRATEQWFISMEKHNLRHLSLKSIEQVTWIPPWGRERIRGMLENRPDWCISRQRSWGVPIPALYCNQCHQAILSQDICDRISSLFIKEGSDAWFLRSSSELLPSNFACDHCGGIEFSKEEDILDVWFDSGVSHAAVVERHPELGNKADLYLEGSDQHRGWFHTALLTSVGTRGQAPYQNVLTHGFALDGDGRKMSKSVGNVISPQEITNKFGAEILRLWVSAEDYRDDVRISNEILNRLVEAYRKFRNTSRFLLGNLYDFDPERDSVKPKDLAGLDRWILQRVQKLLSTCLDAYEKFEFHVVFHSLNNFCSVDLSALYLDIVKDRLYCCAPSSQERRSAQTTVHRILEVLVHLMAPILSFTAEEIWQYIPKHKAASDSILMSQITGLNGHFGGQQSSERWDQIFLERGELMKALEIARNHSIIGHSLDAQIVLYPKDDQINLSILSLLQNNQKEAEDILIVSRVRQGIGNPEAADELILVNDQNVHKFVGETSDGRPIKCLYYSALLKCYIEVSKVVAEKCIRCWKLQVDAGNNSQICRRCSEVLEVLA